MMVLALVLMAHEFAHSVDVVVCGGGDKESNKKKRMMASTRREMPVKDAKLNKHLILDPAYGHTCMRCFQTVFTESSLAHSKNAA